MSWYTSPNGAALDMIEEPTELRDGSASWQEKPVPTGFPSPPVSIEDSSSFYASK